VASNNGDGPSQPKGKLLKFPVNDVPTLKVVEPITFKTFHVLVVQSKLVDASSALATLLQIPLKSAETATNFYAKKTERDAQHPFKTMQLYGVILQGTPNEALILLHDCFGLEGPLAIQSYDALRKSTQT
jgi:hypothetical protein